MDNTFHIKLFNDKLRAMNQANAKILTLNAQEARNLQAEIFELMAIISGQDKSTTSPTEITVSMDGGKF